MAAVQVREKLIPGLYLRTSIVNNQYECYRESHATTKLAVYLLKETYTFTSAVLFVDADIDECTTGKHRCRDDEQCRNNEGGYSCVDKCPPGLTRADNGSCIGR